MINLTQPWSAVFILRKVPMILDAEAANFGNAFADIRKGIDVEIVHDITCVIVHPDACVCNFAYNSCASLSRSSLPAMLFDHHCHAGSTCQGAKDFQVLHPLVPLAALSVTKCKKLRDAGSCRLFDLLLVDLEAISRFHVNCREHQHWSHTQITTPVSHLLRLGRFRLHIQYRHLPPRFFQVTGAQSNIFEAAASNPFTRTLQRKLGIWQRHTSDLKVRWLAAAGGLGRCGTYLSERNKRGSSR